MDSYELIMGLMVVLAVVGIIVLALMAVSALIADAKPPINIDANDVGNHINQKVSVTLIIQEHIDEGTKLSFMMHIFIPYTTSSGTTTTTYTNVTYVPIFENYKVYSAKEGVYLALNNDIDFSSGKAVTVIGYVRKEEKSNRYVIEVSEIK
jgi:hypothetical protein